MGKLFKREIGITLIALIITIIVMLILVAVTISVALNGGLFNNARDAREKTQKATDKEVLLAAAAGTIDSKGDPQINVDNMEAQLAGQNWTITDNNNGTLTCKNNDNNKEYLINQTTGKVTEYTGSNSGGESGEETEPETPKSQVEVGNLIPTEAQLAEADELEPGVVYGFDGNGDIVYAYSPLGGYVDIYYDNVEYVWFCSEEDTGGEYVEPFTWYNKDTKQEFNGPIDLSYFQNLKNENGYIDRIIASFAN